MPSSRASSSSSTEPGSVVAGFRIERAIGRGSRSTVYEATQLGLERRVALKLLTTDPQLAARFRRLQWPEHPHAVRLFAAGTWERGHYLAMALVPGPTLAAAHAAGELAPGRLLPVLRFVGAALAAPHAAGIVHGSMTAGNVLLAPGGGALLSDFGLGHEDATPESDLAAFAGLLREYLGVETPAPTAAALVQAAAVALPPPARAARRRRRLVAAGGAVAAAAVLTALGVGLAGSGGGSGQNLPTVPGAQVLGSALAPVGAASLDCEGQPPSGASQQCVLVQTRLPGRPLVASASGAIRGWAVRGARGDLALQVLRRRGATFELVDRTASVHVADAGLHVLPADLPVRAGDLVGLQVSPGAAIGVRPDVTGATTARLFGTVARSIAGVLRGAGTGFDHEVLLRVQYVPGARAVPRGLLTGRAAARAPAGRELAARDIEPRTGQVRTVAVVALGERIALDLLDGERRLVRLPLADVDAGGRLLGFDSEGEPSVRLRWREPGGDVVSHDYAVGSTSLAQRS